MEKKKPRKSTCRRCGKLILNHDPNYPKKQYCGCEPRSTRPDFKEENEPVDVNRDYGSNKQEENW